jgi:hypothetical protein
VGRHVTTGSRRSDPRRRPHVWCWKGGVGIRSVSVAGWRAAGRQFLCGTATSAGAVCEAAAGREAHGLRHGTALPCPEAPCGSPRIKVRPVITAGPVSHGAVLVTCEHSRDPSRQAEPSVRKAASNRALFVAGRRGRTAERELQHGVGRHRERRTTGVMSLPVILAVAAALVLLAVVAVGVWAHWARVRRQTPVTEAQTRAHASPVTRSILSVSPRPRPERTKRS